MVMTVSPTIRALRDSLLLLFWGALVLWIAAEGQLSIYLHPSLQPFTITAGVLLLLLALFGFRGMFRRSSSPSECNHSCDHDHGDHVLDGHGDRESSNQATVPHHTSSHHDKIDAYLAKKRMEDADDRRVKRDHHPVHDHGDNPLPLIPLLIKTLLLLIPLMMIMTGRGTGFTITTVQNRGIIGNINNLPAAKPRSGSLPIYQNVQNSQVTSSSSFVAKDQGLGPSVQQGGTGSSTRTSGPMPAEIIDLLYAVQMPSYREDFEGK